MLLFAELALQQFDGFAQIALDGDDWALLQLPLFVGEIGAQGRQLGFILFVNSCIFIGNYPGPGSHWEMYLLQEFPGYNGIPLPEFWEDRFGSWL